MYIYQNKIKTTKQQEIVRHVKTVKIKGNYIKMQT